MKNKYVYINVDNFGNVQVISIMPVHNSHAELSQYFIRELISNNVYFFI